MLRRGALMSCRAAFVGPHSQFSMTKHAELQNPQHFKQPKAHRDAVRLMNQDYIRRDIRVQEKARYHVCRRCGLTTVTMGFDETPSARLGLWGRCREEKDYTHHVFFPVSREQYTSLIDVPAEQRLTKIFFDDDPS